MSSKNSIVVIGDGWAALGLAGFLSRQEIPVTWVSASGSRMDAPMPGLEVGFDENGSKTWSKLTQLLGIEAGALETGSFVREFRNKAFREPAWTKAPTPEDRKGVRDELLWEAERILAPVFEARFGMTLAEIEAIAREKLLTVPGIRRIEGVPVQSVQVQDKRIQSVTLASGEVVSCEQVYFADRWNTLSQIEGLPKGLSFARKRGAGGILQAVLTHDLPMAGGLRESFFGSLHKEAGEEVERHVWGYFSSDGSKSFWTLCLSPDEGEDNHAIAKKLRRMKTALDKMFSGAGWTPEEKPDFLAHVKSEQVRFEESILFSEGEIPTTPITISEIAGLFFLTDGYGPTSSMTQVEIALRAAGAESLMEVVSEPQEEVLSPALV